MEGVSGWGMWPMDVSVTFSEIVHHMCCEGIQFPGKGV